MCKCLRTGPGVAGLFGPQSKMTSSHVQSICDALEIPHIETRWDYRLVRDDYSINLYPHPQALGEAFVSLVQVSYLVSKKTPLLYYAIVFLNICNVRLFHLYQS